MHFIHVYNILWSHLPPNPRTSWRGFADECAPHVGSDQLCYYSPHPLGWHWGTAMKDSSSWGRRLVGIFHYNLVYVMSWQEIQICRDSWNVAGWSGLWDDLGSEAENEWWGRMGRGRGLSCLDTKRRPLSLMWMLAHSGIRTPPAEEASTVRWTKWHPRATCQPHFPVTAMSAQWTCEQRGP